MSNNPQVNVIIRPKIVGFCPCIEPHSRCLSPGLTEFAYVTECKSQGYFLMTINGTVPLVVGQGMSDCVRTMPWFDDFNYQIEAEPATKGDPINPGVRLTKAQQRSLEHAHPELRSH